jgi:hypothetical protein
MLLLFSKGIAQTKIAVMGRYNYTTARVHYINESLGTDVKQPNGFKNGFGLGVLFKVPFDDVLHFSPYISLHKRGYSFKPVSDTIFKYDNSMYYVDIVPALSGDFPVGEKKNTLVLSAGPLLGIALSGTEKTTKDDVVTSKKMRFATDGDYSLFDLGLSTAIGFHTPKMFVEAGYMLGHANINNNFNSLTTFNTKDVRNIRNRMLTFTVGYYIK